MITVFFVNSNPGERRSWGRAASGLVTKPPFRHSQESSPTGTYTPTSYPVARAYHAQNETREVVPFAITTVSRESNTMSMALGTRPRASTPPWILS